MKQHHNFLKISFCTVCMNRSYHLKSTLPENIYHNSDYPELQFILLDYNSTDNLENWIREHMMDQINNGQLIYYRTNEPTWFHRSHSRNMAFRLAPDSILCNVDADNFTGKGFAHYLNDHFNQEPDSFLSVDYYTEDRKYKEAYGRIACRKNDFMKVGGYDEKMSGYGYEDIDFCQRLVRAGIKECHINKEEYLKSISHSNEERLSNEAYVNDIESVFMEYLTPFMSRVIYLFQGQTFSMATLLDKKEGFGNPALGEMMWITGSWKRSSNQLTLDTGNMNILSFGIDKEGHLTGSGENRFYQITDQEFLKKLKFTYPILTNHQQYLNNLKWETVEVNNGNIGKGAVIKNFRERITLN